MGQPSLWSRGGRIMALGLPAARHLSVLVKFYWNRATPLHAHAGPNPVNTGRQSGARAMCLDASVCLVRVIHASEFQGLAVNI